MLLSSVSISLTFGRDHSVSLPFSLTSLSMISSIWFHSCCCKPFFTKLFTIEFQSYNFQHPSQHTFPSTNVPSSPPDPSPIADSFLSLPLFLLDTLICNIATEELIKGQEIRSKTSNVGKTGQLQRKLFLKELVLFPRNSTEVKILVLHATDP